MHSPDLAQSNIARLRELFPDCITEAADETNGEITLAVDFDQLRQELSGHVTEGNQERFRMEWPGKKAALTLANAPTTKVLRPVYDESVDFEGTANIFVEGDNLEALKLLQESYLGKIKMIYIDPPYNTGRDFVYRDNFRESIADYLLASAQQSETSNQLVANTNSNGRFHSTWLSMIYPRLKVARNFLTEDGAIFISIDDCELANLRRLCDEVFGSDNFVGCFTWETKRAARGVPPRNLLMHNHEYILCYAKNESNFRLRGLDRLEEDFSNPDNDPRGLWRSESMKATGAQDNYFSIVDPNTGHEYYANWAFSQARVKQMIEEDLILFPGTPTGTPRQKKFIDSYTNETKAGVTSLGWHSTENATKDLMSLFEGKKIFDFPKPLPLIEYLVSQASTGTDVVLDFFAGSGTTMHAVASANSKDGCNRRFILIQEKEKTDPSSEARKAGFDSISMICKERMRRAGLQILGSLSNPDWSRDIGFRALRLDTSTLKEVFRRPDELQQADLLEMSDNIKDDRSIDDLLFHVLISFGLELSLPVRKDLIQEKTVFFVDENALIACFDKGITEDLAKVLASYSPLRVVFRDSGFVSDTVKINVEQILQQLSPTTDLKTI